MYFSLSWVIALFWPLVAFWLFSPLTCLCLCIFSMFCENKDIWYDIYWGVGWLVGWIACLSYVCILILFIAITQLKNIFNFNLISINLFTVKTKYFHLCYLVHENVNVETHDYKFWKQLIQWKLLRHTNSNFVYHIFFYSLIAFLGVNWKFLEHRKMIVFQLIF